MAFSDIIKKLADASEVLSVEEKEEVYVEARRMEQTTSLFNSMVIPGSSSLKLDNIIANNAEINDAEIESATAGGGDVSLDGEGIWIKNQEAAFGFEDTGDNRFQIIIFSDGFDNLVAANQTGGGSFGQGEGHIRFAVDTVTHKPLYFYFKEDYAEAEVPEFSIQNTIAPHTSKGTIKIGNGAVQIWGGVGGKTTVFNETGDDIDFRIESDNNTHALYLDAANNLISFFGSPNTPATLLTLDGGTEQRFEFGGDHYIPIRTSTNPNIYFNEANQDMNFYIDGVTTDGLFTLDAGLDVVGIGGIIESATKLYVTGEARVTSKMKFGNTNADVQAYVSGSKFVLRYVDGGTIRYKYLDMAGTGVTWVHTTTAP